MIDYYAIHSRVKDIISAGTYTDTIKEVFIEAMERDMLLGNMPFINIRLVDADLQLITIPTGYYGRLNFEIDVITFDLSEFRKAAITRDRILKEVQQVLQANRQFTAGVETSTIGPRVVFGSGTVAENDLQAGHIAFATMNFVVEVHVDSA